MYPPAVNAPLALPVAMPMDLSGAPQPTTRTPPSHPPQPQPQPPHHEEHQPQPDEIVAQGSAALTTDEDLQQLIKLMSKQGMIQKLHLLMQTREE